MSISGSDESLLYTGRLQPNVIVDLQDRCLENAEALIDATVDSERKNSARVRFMRFVCGRVGKNSPVIRRVVLRNERRVDRILAAVQETYT